MHLLRSVSPRRLSLALLAATLTACASTRSTGHYPAEFPMESGRCRMAASQLAPIVTEWPASEKANLEVLLRSGGIAVTYSGCTLRLLPQCRLQGTYAWQRTTPASDTFEINDENDLYAKLPLGAVSLQGELKRWGKLSVQTSVAGQMHLQGFTPNQVPSDGECARATHVLGGLAVGAFTLSRGGGASASAGAGIEHIGEVGGQVTRTAGQVRAAGDAQVCSLATDEAPHPNCRSPLQAFLLPIPGRHSDEGPPGTVRVDFVSAHANSRWDVYVDDKVICTTPCSGWVAPTRPILLRTRDEGFFLSPDKVQVPDLQEHAASGALQLQAHPTANGRLVTGITFTSLGGMTTMTGLMLSLLGCTRDNSPGMCTGGVVTLGVGSAVTAGAIWLILESGPRAEIKADTFASRESEPTLRFGPGFIAGTF